MDLYFTIMFFFLGTIFGSFYNVVGYRIPKKQSLVFPSSHCPNCERYLTFLDLIPIFSYLFLRGKCRYCKNKISPFYLIFEIVNGLLFSLCFLSFGFSYELIIALTFVSLISIVVISDIIYMIIPDEVLVFFSILLAIEIVLIKGVNDLTTSLFSGIIAFTIMYLLKVIGDKIFKKESMGGGDIKLMFLFGMVLNWPLAILSIFVGSIIGLPISLILLVKNKGDIIPFGPYLGLGALIVLFLEKFINIFLINI